MTLMTVAASLSEKCPLQIMDSLKNETAEPLFLVLIDDAMIGIRSAANNKLSWFGQQAIIRISLRKHRFLSPVHYNIK